MRNTWLYYRRERCNTNLKGFIAYTEAARCIVTKKLDRKKSRAYNEAHKCIRNGELA